MKNTTVKRWNDNKEELQTVKILWKRYSAVYKKKKDIGHRNEKADQEATNHLQEIYFEMLSDSPSSRIE